MTTAAARRRNRFRLGALVVGVLLFAGTLYYIDVPTAAAEIRRLGAALPLALFFSGVWHLTRTWAWAWCFPQPRQVGFMRLVRVRFSAEAFSYLTLRGIAGEPLKVVLLADRVDARTATAAVALERIAYLVGTIVIVGVASIVAISTLPLTRVWFRVFRAFALGAAVVTAFAAVVVTGRGTYLDSLLRRIDRRLNTRISGGKVGRFVSAVERQVLDLVRGSPRRLLVLLFTTALSYVLMVIEAWVILRGAGASITPIGAFTVETFSRVASFASAFIPANLGALEASSFAAVAAIGVGGGAALGLARRIRGLFWAGLGLAIYPRGLRPAARSERNTLNADANTAARGRGSRPTLLYFPWAPGVTVSPATRLAGLPLAERVLRSAWRAGYGRAIIWAGPDARTSPRERGILESAGDVTIATTEREWQDALREGSSEILTAVGAGTIVSPALLTSAAAVALAAGGTADVPAGAHWPASGALRVGADVAQDPARLAGELEARRQRALPLPGGEDVAEGRARLAIRITRPADLAAAEATIRRAAYKDTDSRIARFNRRLSLPVSVALIRTPLTANQLSVMIVTLGFYSAWLFSIGRYWTGVLAAFLSLAASVLDGCDGEIARLKYQESALGCWIETVGDYAYYLAIFTGLTIGAVRQTGVEAFYWVGGIAVGGTLLAFALLIFLRSRITAGQPEKLNAIARDRFEADGSLMARLIWRVSFVATRAAMPYGIMLFALFNLLPAIVVLAAIGAHIYWISLAVKLRTLLTATPLSFPPSPSAS